MNEHSESRVHRGKTTAASNAGSFASRANAETDAALEPETPRPPAHLRNKEIEVGDYVLRDGTVFSGTFSQVTQVERISEAGPDFEWLWVTTADGSKTKEFPRALVSDQPYGPERARSASRPINWDEMGSSEKDLWEERSGRLNR